MRIALGYLFALCAAVAGSALAADSAVPAHGVIGVVAEQLTPDYWIARAHEPDAVVLDRAAIAAENARLLRLDPTMHDLRGLPATLDREQVTAWIHALSARPAQTLYDTAGTSIPAETLDSLVDDLDLSAIPASQPTRYGLVVQRADLRSFPTSLRVFKQAGDTDIDRFQESALYPGTPVVIAHTSRDGRWWFVVSARYRAWMERRYVAEGSAAQVLDYADKSDFRVVTGAAASTVFVPAPTALSQLRLDMSARVPVLTDWPAGKAVNGQNPYTSYVIELPLRDADGRVHFAPALLQHSGDTAADYLPLTRANLLRQAFKFLGERYGWGNDYQSRDCSGFVSDIYASLGVQMPRNTRDQSVSPALNKRSFGSGDDRAARLAAVRALQVGDLVYIPGHVMMAIGNVDGEPYVIHDTTGINYRRADGTLARTPLNAVSVSPLLPLQFDERDSYVDRMTAIVRIRADADGETPRP